MSKYITGVLILLLCGCSSLSSKPSRAVLMDRKTGEIKTCTVDRWRSQKSYDDYQACKEALEKQGYSLWSEY